MALVIPSAALFSGAEGPASAFAFAFVLICHPEQREGPASVLAFAFVTPARTEGAPSLSHASS
jgi:hypothetical protein